MVIPSLASCVLGVALLFSAGAEDDRVTRTELRQLQSEVERLDDSLADMGDSDPQAPEFERRADQIREDLTRLKDQMLWGEEGEHEASGVSRADIEAVRQDTIDLRNDIDRSRDSARDVASDVTVPEGTPIDIRLEHGLSSETARVEDRIDASVAAPVRVDGSVAIPAGTAVQGLVRNVEAARRPARGGRLDLTFDSMVLSDGRKLDIRARVVSVKEDKVDKSKVGLGAVLGGLLGGVIEGGEGALVGALVGGGGAFAGTQGDDVELPPGTVLTLRLERPVPIARR